MPRVRILPKCCTYLPRNSRGSWLFVKVKLSWNNLVFHLGKSGVLGRADQGLVNNLKEKCLILGLDTSHFWGKNPWIEVSDDMLREITRESTSLQEVINK